MFVLSFQIAGNARVSRASPGIDLFRVGVIRSARERQLPKSQHYGTLTCYRLRGRRILAPITI